MTSVLVVGDAGLDVVARHDGPLVAGGDRRARVRMTVGGAAANTAVWLAHLGASPSLVARVGDDLSGRQVREQLTAAGVRCSFTVDPVDPTMCVVVLVDADGERSMLPDHGAGANLVAADLDPDLLAGARHLHLSGYVLLDPASREAGTAMLAAAKAAGVSTSVDPQSAALISDPAAFVELIRGVDLLLPNAEELRVLAGEPLLDVVGGMAITDGRNGAVWIAPGEQIAVPAPSTSCVDSTGAGDAFNAGFLTAWLAGASASAALTSGVQAGCLAVTTTGAHPPVVGVRV